MLKIKSGFSYHDWQVLKKYPEVNISIYTNILYCCTNLADFYSKCRMMCKIGDVYKKEIKVNCGKIITLCSWAPQDGRSNTQPHSIKWTKYKSIQCKESDLGISGEKVPLPQLALEQSSWIFCFYSFKVFPAFLVFIFGIHLAFSRHKIKYKLAIFQYYNNKINN